MPSDIVAKNTDAASSATPIDAGAAPRTLRSGFWNLYAVCYDSLTGLKPYQQMMGDILDALELQDDMAVLDYGCGTGNFERFALARAPRVRVTGIDSSRSMLQRAERKVPVSVGAVFVFGDSPDAAGLRPASCDRIVTTNVLYTLPDPAATLAQLRDLLKPDGLMVHATPQTRFNPMGVFWAHCGMCRGIGDFFATLRIIPALIMVGIMNIWIVKNGRDSQYFWSQDELTRMFAANGLNITEIKPTYAGQDWLVRCVQRKQGGE
ncbi:MAG: class I SAM-dependent methyltransferase [Capsulimonadales bacterium]|nr:class I SAM-dependent methyltransferase [Capsulimonadales bacterium]